MGQKRQAIEVTTVEYSKAGAIIGAVKLIGALFHCTSCGAVKPADQFGLRLERGVVRNQAQCSSCRSKYPSRRQGYDQTNQD